jgi:hypothetical protein
MATVITSPADVVNLALSRIGIKDRIGNIYEGSAAAKAALDVYAQTRDAVLRESNFGFSEKIDAAVLSGNVAPSPWSFEYVYPSDCLKLRDLFDADYLADKNNPIPLRWVIGGPDTGKVIWANVVGVTLVYTRQVTDPTKWEPLFVEAFAAALGRRMAPVLASMEVAKAEAEDEKVSDAIATGTVG